MTDDDLQQKYERHAAMLANRVKKRFQHFYKRFTRQKIEVFRLYDWDIPEIRAVVDWYGGHLVVGEYTRQQSTPDWLPMMAEAVARVLNVSADNLHLKERFYGKSDGRRYQRIDYTDRMFAVSERDLQFYVNPWDYVDTGLFADHRNTRRMIRAEAENKEFLNLFCYTGSFSCYAARGGARSSVSVDRSKTAIKWARRNMALNRIDPANHQLVQTHAIDYLAKARSRKQYFDLAVVDPPSFYSVRTRNDHFDILDAHPRLLKMVAALIRKGGTIYFSTNHQNFTPRFEGLTVSGIREITHQTIPEDYIRKRKSIHRCWRINI